MASGCLVVPRDSYEEHTLAVVEFDGPELTEENFLSRLEEALSAWVETEEGAAAAAEAGDDFNIGDLSQYVGDDGVPPPTLCECLDRRGIQFLAIRIVTSATPCNWVFDRVLMRLQDRIAYLHARLEEVANHASDCPYRHGGECLCERGRLLLALQELGVEP